MKLLGRRGFTWRLEEAQGASFFVDGILVDAGAVVVHREAQAPGDSRDLDADLPHRRFAGGGPQRAVSMPWSTAFRTRCRITSARSSTIARSTTSPPP